MLQRKCLRLLLLAIVLFPACTSRKSEVDDSVKQAFTDDGKMAIKLKDEFKCEAITLDKWESSEITDSTFSFCLINAQKIPFSNGGEDVLKKIARSVRASVKNPDHYNSYHIVFVDKKGRFATSMQIYRFGGVLWAHNL